MFNYNNLEYYTVVIFSVVTVGESSDCTYTDKWSDRLCVSICKTFSSRWFWSTVELLFLRSVLGECGESRNLSREDDALFMLFLFGEFRRMTASSLISLIVSRCSTMSEEFDAYSLFTSNRTLGISICWISLKFCIIDWLCTRNSVTLSVGDMGLMASMSLQRSSSDEVIGIRLPG